MFLKQQVPLAICFVTGVVFAAQYYIPHETSERVLTEMNDWLLILTGFASLLGLGSLIQVHYLRLRRRVAGWGYSLVVFVTIAITVAVGIASEGKTDPDPATGVRPAFGFFYDFMLVPLQGTMFSILAFFVASVAFRSFRARSPESALLLVAAVLLLVGRVPLGELAWQAVTPEGWPGIGEVCGWVMDHLNMAARRGILLGVALGVVATSLKIILGIERSYLGGGGE